MTHRNPAPALSGGLSWKTKAWRGTWMLGAIVATAVVVAQLLRPHQPPVTPPSNEVTRVETIEPVRAVSAGLLAVAMESPLQKELATFEVVSEKVSLPLLSVSGTILARIREGTELIEDRWQFSSPELSTSYSDWLRAKNEIVFAESQLTKTTELAAAETTFLQTNLKRFESLSSGTVPEKDLRQAQSALLKAQLQGEKDIFAAKSAQRVAIKQQAAVERELSQAGIEPVVFSRAAEHMVLVAANVPEAKVSQVHEGQSCEVEFYGYPDKTFPAHVEAVSSSLTQERRTLRVLFDLTDDKLLLKPGMFAEVGLGTDARETILIPATALLHIGRKDYVLVAATADQWRVTAVTVGEVLSGRCEVLEGLKSGDRIISRGAILLKTVAAQTLTMPATVAEKP